MKALLLKMVLRPKLVGQITVFITALAASAMVSFIPGIDTIVGFIATNLFDAPDMPTDTKSALIFILTPLIGWVINSVAQLLISKDNNAVLEELKFEGTYSGPLDGWAGPKALEGIKKLAQAADATKYVGS